MYNNLHLENLQILNICYYFVAYIKYLRTFAKQNTNKKQTFNKRNYDKERI